MVRGQRTGGRGGYGRREVRVLKRWEEGEMGGGNIFYQSKKRLKEEGKKKRREPGMQAMGDGMSGTAVPSPTYVRLSEGLMSVLV